MCADRLSGYHFQGQKLLFKQCRDFLIGLNVDINTIRTAFKKAEYEQAAFEKEIVSYNEKVLQDIGKNKTLTVMLAGRPYHSDPLIQHKISDMISEMGVHVITDDLVRDKEVGIDRHPFRCAMGIYQSYFESRQMVCYPRQRDTIH